MKYEELVKKAIEMLKEDEDLFVSMVDELDSWNGFADGYRVYNMYELDDLFCDCKVSDFLSKIGSHFDLSDDYFADTIWGLESTDDKYTYYLDNTTEEEVFDNILECYTHLYFDDKDFEDLIEQIADYDEEDEEDEE